MSHSEVIYFYHILFDEKGITLCNDHEFVIASSVVYDSN